MIARIAAALVALATQTACALGPTPEDRFGVGAGLSYASPEFDLDDAERDSMSRIVAENVLGFDLRGSCALNEDFEVEVALQSYSNLELDLEGRPSADLDVAILTVNLRGFAEITEQSRMYAAVGAGAMRSELSDRSGLLREFDDTAPVLRGAVGTEYDILDPLALFLEGSYVVPLGDLRDLDLFAVAMGLKFRF